MVSFNHGVSSLTRKDPALKYNLYVLRPAEAQTQGQVAGARARSRRVGRQRGGSWKETPDLLPPPAASPLPQTPYLGAFGAAKVSHQETGQPQEWNCPPAGEERKLVGW